MKKLQTFLIYVLIIVGFFVVSELLSSALLNQMYVKLDGAVEKEMTYNGEKVALDVEIVEAKATKMNGYLTARVTNNTNTPIDNAYLKIDMFAKKDLKAISRYMKISDLKPGETEDYTLNFRAGYVDNYKVSVKNDFPDEDYVFEILGYEFNTKSIFGIDLSNYINAKAIKEAGFNTVTSIFRFFGTIGHRFVVSAQTVPLWGYVGALIILSGIL